MASGTIDLGTSGNLKGRIVWSSTSNGTAKNSSTVKGTIQGARTNSYTTKGTFTGNLNLGGVNKTFSVYSSSFSDSWVTLLSFSITKAHNSNGTGTCAISGKINGPSGTSLEGHSVSASKTVTLDTIPRQASITAAPNFNDNSSSITITYSNPAGNSVTALDAAIYDNAGSVAYAGYRALTKTGTSYTFKLTSTELNKLYNAAPNSKTLKVRFYVRTTIGTTKYYSYLTKTMTIVDANPTLSPTVIDKGSVSTVLTGDPDGIVIKGYNAMRLSSGASANKGATLTKQTVTCGDRTIALTNGSASSSHVTSGDFVFKVTDSRGNTTTKTVSRTLINYIALTCNISTEATLETETTAKVRIIATGNYYNGSFGAKNNTLKVRYNYKKNSETESGWTDFPADSIVIDGTKYTATVDLPASNYKDTYKIQCAAADEPHSSWVKSSIKNVVCRPVFDWGKDDFRINVPLSENLTFKDNKKICYMDENGNTYNIFDCYNVNKDLIIGYDYYVNKSNRYSTLAGHDVLLGVSNIPSPASYRPYYRHGDSFNITIRTAGYVTNAKQDVTFMVPVSQPMIGNPTVTVSSVNGFILRQGAQYTHGSSAEVYVKPDSYTAVLASRNGVYVTARFSNTTNVTNNDAIGIYWSGTITFS